MTETLAPEKTDTLLSPRQAARYLAGDDEPLSTRTLETWRWKGVGPRYRKIGHYVRYAKSDLDAFLAAATRESTSQAAA